MRITESQLRRIVSRVLSESDGSPAVLDEGWRAHAEMLGFLGKEWYAASESALAFALRYMRDPAVREIVKQLDAANGVGQALYIDGRDTSQSLTGHPWLLSYRLRACFEDVWTGNDAARMRVWEAQASMVASYAEGKGTVPPYPGDGDTIRERLDRIDTLVTKLPLLHSSDPQSAELIIEILGGPDPLSATSQAASLLGSLI